MHVTGNEIMMGVGLIAGLFVAFQLLKLTYRVCDTFPLLGLALSLGFLGWVYQNPDVLPDLLSDASPDVLAQGSLTSGDAASDAEAMDANVSDEEMVEHYRQQNIHFAHEVSSAPSKARRTVGL
jgi:hypothetical protein